MASRQPVASDFPASLNTSIILPPPGQSPVNVLLLLHGLGDSTISFTNLAKQLSLPETTSITIQAPHPLPFDLGGFHWGDDILFDPSQGNMDHDTGFQESSRMLREDIIEQTLFQKCGYKARNILFFGYGQGAIAAIAAALGLNLELGGIVSIGGPVPSSHWNSQDAIQKSRTPLIVLGGSSATSITQSALSLLKKSFVTVEYIKWPRPGDAMPTNRDEMLPIMKFLARRLQSRAGTLEGSVEVG